MAILKDASVYEKRVLQPTVLETKEQLLIALRSGSIKTSKYNLLSEEDKLFVELVSFGEYSPETAVRAIYKDIGTYAATFARRLMSKKEIIETLDELTEAKDKSFRASLARSRELALKKVEFIMNNSNDEANQLKAAQIIIDKSNEITKMNKNDNDSKPSGIRISIAVDKMEIKPEDIILPLTDDAIDAEYASIGEKAPKRVRKIPDITDPDTGLPYTISYEGVNSYEDSNKEDEEDD